MTLLTTEELAEELKVSTQTISNWAHEGKIPGIKLSNQAGWRFELNKVLGALAKQEVERGEEKD
jgi:excisionase family DNA binding protein